MWLPELLLCLPLSYSAGFIASAHKSLLLLLLLDADGSMCSGSGAAHKSLHLSLLGGGVVNA